MHGRTMLFGLFLFSLLGCTSSSDQIVRYEDPWWYDNYYHYWSTHYYWCCESDDEWDTVLRQWWQSLDDEKRESIKDQVNDWIESGDAPNLDAIKKDLRHIWDGLPSDRQQAIVERGEAVKANRATTADIERIRSDSAREQEGKRPTTQPATPIQRPVRRPVVPTNRPMRRR